MSVLDALNPKLYPCHVLTCGGGYRRTWAPFLSGSGWVASDGCHWFSWQKWLGLWRPPVGTSRAQVVLCPCDFSGELGWPGLGSPLRSSRCERSGSGLTSSTRPSLCPRMPAPWTGRRGDGMSPAPLCISTGISRTQPCHTGLAVQWPLPFSTRISLQFFLQLRLLLRAPACQKPHSGKRCQFPLLAGSPHNGWAFLLEPFSRGSQSMRTRSHGKEEKPQLFPQWLRQFSVLPQHPLLLHGLETTSWQTSNRM